MRLFTAMMAYFGTISAVTLTLVAFVAIQSMQATVSRGIKMTYDALLALSADRVAQQIQRLTSAMTDVAAGNALQQWRRSPAFARAAWLDELTRSFDAYLAANPPAGYVRYLSREGVDLIEQGRGDAPVLARPDLDRVLTVFGLEESGDPDAGVNAGARVLGIEREAGGGYLRLAVPSVETAPDGSRRIAGFVEVGLLLEHLDGIIRGLELTQSPEPRYATTALLTDADGTLILGYGPRLDDQRVRLGTAEDAASYTFRLPGLHWQLTASVPKALLYRDIERLRFILIGLIFGGLGVATVMTYLASRRVTRPIAELVKATEAVGSGRLDHQIQIQSFRELSVLGERFNEMARELQSTLDEKLRETDRKARLERELEVASALQARFMPRDRFTHPRVELCATSMPAASLGGDWYAYHLYGDDWLHVHIGDVTGHGPASALMAAFAKGATDMLYAGCSRLGLPEVPLDQLHETLNRMLAVSGNDQAFMTLFSLAVHLPTGRMTYLNSGHMPQFVAQPGGKSRALTGEGRSLLGFVADRPVSKPERAQLVGDELILLYSDGLLEAAPRRKGRRFGVKQLGELTSEFAGRSAFDMRDELQSLLAESAAAERPDDVTVVAIKLLKAG